MKVAINSRKNVLHKVEAALHEFYSRSIYKKMVDDVTDQIKHVKNNPTKGLYENKPQRLAVKKRDSSKDIDNDLPGMLFI